MSRTSGARRVRSAQDAGLAWIHERRTPPQAAVAVGVQAPADRPAALARGARRDRLAADRPAVAGFPAADPASNPEPTSSATQGAASDLPVPGTATPSAAPSATPTPEATAGAAPSATPSGSATPSAKPCVNRDLTVEALTDLDTYEAGQNPQLSIRLTNNGSADCTLNVGTSGQSFTIASGSDVWWRSTDCQTEPSDMVVLLAAGSVGLQRRAAGVGSHPLVRRQLRGCESADRARWRCVVPSERRDRRHPLDAVEADLPLLTLGRSRGPSVPRRGDRRVVAARVPL